MATEPTAQDQYMLELLNRARLNPQAEANRYPSLGGNLNEEVPTTKTISTAPKQALAVNLKLFNAAQSHSQWMLDNDIFAHEGVNGSLSYTNTKTNIPGRIVTAGYSPYSTAGENLALYQTTAPLNATTDYTRHVREQHEDLFVDPGVQDRGHRTNMMNPNFREVGISSLIGVFTTGGLNANSVITTQDFGSDTNPNAFLTGVVYTDKVLNDDFYTVGEGLGNITINAVNVVSNLTTTTTSLTAGGYSLRLAPGTYNVTFGGDFDNDGKVDTSTPQSVTIGTQNVKTDFASDTYISQPLPIITIAKGTDAAEPATNGSFILTRTGDTTAELIVNVTAPTGTATSGVDYQLTSGNGDTLAGGSGSSAVTTTVKFAAGSSTATVNAITIDDTIVEGTETIGLALATGTGYTLGTATSAIVNLLDDDVAPVVLPIISIAKGTDAAEPATAGSFTLSRTGDTAAALTVNLDVPTGTATNGVDYTTLATTATFAAGSATATVNVSVIDDTLVEGTETSGLALKTGTGYTLGTTTSASINLADNDVAPPPPVPVLPIISIAKGTDTAEPATAGSFTLTRTGATTAALTVNLDVPTGTATNGVDYTTLATTATFAAGSATATVNVNVIDDTLVEGTETISLALKTGTGYTLGTTTSASINLADNDVAPPPPVPVLPIISIAKGTDAAEPATNGSLILTRTGDTTAELIVNVTAPTGTATSGVDYQLTSRNGDTLAGGSGSSAVTTTVKFAAGSSTATVNATPIDDTLVEGTETIGLALKTGTGYTLGTTTSASINLADNDVAPPPPVLVLPIISLATNEPNAAETKQGKTLCPGQFTVTRTGDLTQALTTNYAVTGTATNGTDYQTLDGIATFKAGAATALIDVNVIDDKIYEGDETVTLKLVESTNYTIASANSGTVTIADNDRQKPHLTQPNQHYLEIEGGAEKSCVKFTQMAHGTGGKNQVCAFKVDDEQGRIGGIKPGEKGYLNAALDRSQVVFSSLGNSSFDRDSQRHLNFTPNDRVEFLLIGDDTLEGVKTDRANGKSTAKVLFSLDEANTDRASQAKFTALPNDGGYDIAWEDSPNNGGNGDFKDLVMKVETLDSSTAPIGTGLQGKSEGDVIDLGSFAGRNLTVDTHAISNAAYNNYIGFYAVADDKGTLANGLKPGDAGYAEAAIKIATLNCFKNETKSGLTVAGGQILAPIVVANGTFADFLNQNPQNKADSNVHAYCNYIGANPDKVDHFRLLGDHKFGVEDMYGGGDRDYNDIVFQMNVKG
jgi:hypothetical protein